MRSLSRNLFSQSFELLYVDFEFFLLPFMLLSEFGMVGSVLKGFVEFQGELMYFSIEFVSFSFSL